MNALLVRAAVVTFIFALAILVMAVGLIMRGKIMRGGCGSVHSENGEPVGCDACSKKTLNLCDDETDTGLVDVSLTGTFGRYTHKK